MSDFKTSTTDVQGLSGTLAAHAAEFSARLDQARAVSAVVIGGTWTGGTATELGTALEHWFVGAGKVQDVLSEMSVLLGNAAGAYEITESSLAAASGQALSDAHLPAPGAGTR
ncbi:WXG100 family type VII secretion target [Arthrobacter sp. GAS37]|uniref:WXG100 family type VII secretion target n=1 Tax=Arthrobacter sp. GAS37 TaxID=3156261 RepID=UPI0038327E7D